MRHLACYAAVSAATVNILACSDAALEGSDDETGTTWSEGSQRGSADVTNDSWNSSGVMAIDASRELLITKLSVVEDPVRTKWPAGEPAGPQASWTFGRLMQHMAGTTKPSEFVLEWLQQWEQDQTINGHTAPARPAIKSLVIDPWLQASGSGELNLRLAPFRLLAIVNRLDLRSNKGPGSVSAGEGRFVFGLVDPAGAPLPFTVIFEYVIPVDKNKDIKKWAKRWHKLGKMPFGPLFNAQLQGLTDVFTLPQCPSKPNGSCLGQIRTNEVKLAPANGWELREFRISSQTGKLYSAPVIQTPDTSMNGTDELMDLINTNEAAMKQRLHSVAPELLAASALAPSGYVWNAPGIVDSEARFGFAITTCNGCHTVETGTSFLHVKNRAAGAESVLSAFMTGTTVIDPVSGASRTFNELASRAQDMQLVLSTDPEDLFGASRDDDVDNNK